MSIDCAGFKRHLSGRISVPSSGQAAQESSGVNLFFPPPISCILLCGQDGRKQPEFFCGDDRSERRKERAESRRKKLRGGSEKYPPKGRRQGKDKIVRVYASFSTAPNPLATIPPSVRLVYFTSYFIFALSDEIFHLPRDILNE